MNKVAILILVLLVGGCCYGGADDDRGCLSPAAFPMVPFL